MNSKTKSQMREFLQAAGLPPHEVNQAERQYIEGESNSEELLKYMRQIMEVEKGNEFVIIGRLFFKIIDESETSALQAFRIHHSLLMLHLANVKLKQRLEEEKKKS